MSRNALPLRASFSKIAFDTTARTFMPAMLPLSAAPRV